MKHHYEFLTVKELFSRLNQPINEIKNPNDLLKQVLCIFFGEKNVNENIYILPNSDFGTYGSVIVIKKNSDFTEGSGPMKLHKIYRTIDIDNALEYVMSQDGIYGSNQKVKHCIGINVNGVPYYSSSFNGYELEIIKFSV